MSDLIDRIAGTGGIPDGRKINLHRFMAVERLYALGEWSRAQIATEFDLQGDELTQAVQLADEIDSQSNILNKTIYILRVESVCMCIEDHNDRLYHDEYGDLDRLQIYEDLLITG